VRPQAGRASPSEARAAWEAIAPTYAQARTKPWPVVVGFLRDLPPGARVLDAGSGSGRHARVARAMGLRCVALDAARGFGPEVQGDAAALPLREASCDAVLLVAVLGTMPRREDRIAALAEARRVLRPHGKLLATVWAKWQPDYLRALVGRGTWTRVGPGEVLVPWSGPGGQVVRRPYHLSTGRTLRADLAAAGWAPGEAQVRPIPLGRGRWPDNLLVEAERRPGNLAPHTFM
jgi:tRNA (uracil-5-)-methyltransferase TRM9